jgi:apolipoprotein D and lipocalin family protein
MKKYICAVLGIFLTGCATAPKGINPVSGFDVKRYLGVWYEIARLDHSFERGLVAASAEYTARPDGGINVVNRGYSTSARKWKQAEGRAYFTGDNTVGQLKVTFFRPFYGAYNVIELAQDYSYSMVAGPSRNYLWILARSPELAPDVKQRLLARARELGFATDKLVFPAPVPPGR